MSDKVLATKYDFLIPISLQSNVLWYFKLCIRIYVRHIKGLYNQFEKIKGLEFFFGKNAVSFIEKLVRASVAYLAWLSELTLIENIIFQAKLRSSQALTSLDCTIFIPSFSKILGSLDLMSLMSSLLFFCNRKEFNLFN